MRAMCALPVADERVGTGHGLQHVREVFRAHGGFLRHHVATAHDAGHDVVGELGFGHVVDGGRVVALELEGAGGTKGGAGVVGDVAHALLDEVEHVQAEGAHGALHFAVVGHDVGGFAGVDHGDRDDARIDRLFVARDDGLKGLHHLAGDRHRVDAVVGQRGMAAFAVNGDFEFIARRHDRPRAQGELPFGQARPVVHAVDGLHGEQLKQAIAHHLAGATAALFCRLKNEIHRAVKLLVLRQVLGRSQEHGHMAVVAAGVHLAGVLAAVVELVELLHGQRIHVGAQANGAVTGAVFQDAHHTRFA